MEGWRNKIPKYSAWIGQKQSRLHHTSIRTELNDFKVLKSGIDVWKVKCEIREVKGYVLLKNLRRVRDYLEAYLFWQETLENWGRLRLGENWGTSKVNSEVEGRKW